MNLKKIEDRITREVHNTLMEVARSVAEEAKKTAPVDTGTYREEIHVEETQNPLRVEVVSDAVDPETGYHYSGVVEFKHTLTARGGNMARAAQTVKQRMR